MRNPFDKLLNWYFTKNSLPYWCIFLIDCGIVMFSGFMVYWIFNKTDTLYENTLQVLATMSCFSLMSILGFRLFHTYSGFMRYSSFVDLMRVVYGNIVNLFVVLIAQNGMDFLPREYFVHYNTTSIFLIYIIATLLMWALRVFVKTLYDVAFSNSRAIRVLIYGTMTGGVGLAKNIQSQRPRRFVVKGFITHFKKAKHQQIMGEKVYSVDEDLAEVIQKNDIEGVLVSPYRTAEFRNNQKIQDIILGAGAKIFMAQNAKMLDAEGEEHLMTEDSYNNVQMKEVNQKLTLQIRDVDTINKALRWVEKMEEATLGKAGD